MTAGERISTLRKRVGMTPKELARHLHLQERDILDAESGKRTLSRKQLIEAGRIFGVNPDYIAGKTTDPTPIAEVIPSPQPKKEEEEKKRPESEEEEKSKVIQALQAAVLRKVQYLYIAILILGAVALGLLTLPYTMGAGGSSPQSFYQVLKGPFQEWFTNGLANAGFTFTLLLFIGIILEMLMAIVFFFTDNVEESSTCYRSTIAVTVVISAAAVIAMILTGIGQSQMGYSLGVGAFITPCLQLVTLLFPLAYRIIALSARKRRDDTENQ